MSLLHYYRCHDCLGICTVEEKLEGSLQCCACKCTNIAYLGRTDIKKDVLVEDCKLSPCDSSCTSARGPHCKCECKGENHGTHRKITITRDTVHNVAQLEWEIEKAECLALTAEEYRRSVKCAEEVFAKKYPRAWQQMGSKVGAQSLISDPNDRAEFGYFAEQYNKANKSTRHNNRLKILQDLIYYVSSERYDVKEEMQEEQYSDWIPVDFPEMYYAH